jgi:hypothetical protein
LYDAVIFLFVRFILDSYSLQERQFGKWNVGCMDERGRREGGDEHN